MKVAFITRRAVLLSCCCLLLFLLEEQHQASAAGVVQLTSDNFDAATEGKNLFVKFYAPWCAHCRAMADDWNRLAEDFQGHEYTVIGEVDCTSDEGKQLCEEFEVPGFPTLIYGDPMNADVYEGDMDYDTLSKFAKDRLSKPICSILYLNKCSDKEKEIIQSLMEKPINELERLMIDVEEEVKAEEGNFDAEVTKIQEQYDSLVTHFNENLEHIKESHNYKFVEQILMLYLESQNQDTTEEL